MSTCTFKAVVQTLNCGGKWLKLNSTYYIDPKYITVTKNCGFRPSIKLREYYLAGLNYTSRTPDHSLFVSFFNFYLNYNQHSDINNEAFYIQKVCIISSKTTGAHRVQPNLII